MNHHKYTLIIGGAGLMAWISWVLVLLKLDPYETMSLALSFFYITLFIALVCTFTIIGFYFRVWLFRNEIFYKHINTALRQGTLLSLIAIFCLVLQMVQVLNWWTGLMLIVIAVLLESYFSAKESEYSG